MMTDAEFKEHLIERRDGARVLAKAYMRRGASRWIDVALEEGWAKTLQGWIVEVCRKRHEETGRLPAFGELDHFELKNEQHDWAQAYGSQFLRAELEEIQKARNSRRAA